jgi:uncharacterized protein YecE (DUF72 family)
VELYVGTSGWLYDWNLGGSLEWYVRRTSLNAIELNSSFYRTPFPSQVKSWSVKGKSLRWSIKILKYISHYYKLSGRALELWDKFNSLFKPMDSLVDFYLLQLPPNFKSTQGNRTRLSDFARSTGLKWRLAVEFRDRSWVNEDTVGLCRDLEVTLVSIDSPIGTEVWSSSDTVYLRLHGRSEWYLYDYSLEELRELSRAILELKPEKVYIFFNNNHYMLENARTMLKILGMHELDGPHLFSR